MTERSPLRVLGLARMLAGGWFITTGVATLRQYPDYLPQLQRLSLSDMGATDAPIRALLLLTAAAGLVLVGLGLIVQGVRWLPRLALPPEGPAAIERSEVIATLRTRTLPSYAEGPAAPWSPLRRWLGDELAGLTWWRRALVSQGIRAFARAAGLALLLVLLWLVMPRLAGDDVLGPFPTAFVVVLLFVTAIWAALAFLFLAPDHPRIEMVQWSLPAPAGPAPTRDGERIIESRPLRLDQEPAGLAITLGLAGIAVQCLMMPWWNLSPIGYPRLATSLLRHAGSIGGGVLFLVLGGRMVRAAASELLSFRYDSLLVLVEEAGDGMVARAAAVRTESRGVGGPRHILAAVGGPHVRDSAPDLLRP